MSTAVQRPTTSAENARAAAKMIAKEQMKRPGKKVRVVAIEQGFDGFKMHEEGEEFIAWWPDGMKPPSWQVKKEEYVRRQRQEVVADQKASSPFGDDE